VPASDATGSGAESSVIARSWHADFTHYDGRAASPIAGARGWVMWEALAVASDEGGSSVFVKLLFGRS